MINVGVDSAAGFAANRVGQSFANGDIGSFQQKALHFGIGSGIGAATSSSGKRLADALTGGAGAVIAETIAENTSGDLNTRAGLGRLGAAMTAFAAGQDVDISTHAATNAVENNFLVSSSLRQQKEEEGEKTDPNLKDTDQRLSPEEIDQRFSERVRHYRDVLAFEGNREECVRNWIKDVFEDRPPTPRTRARIESSWGETHDKMWRARPIVADCRSALFERDYERGDEYFIQARIKEFSKGENISPEEAGRRHRTVAKRTLDFYKQQQAGLLVGGAIGIAGSMRGRAIPVTTSRKPAQPVASSSNEASSSGVGTNESAGFMGKKGVELKNASYQKNRNVETTIENRIFSGHALDQMQNRGIPPSVVEGAIQTGIKFEAKNSLNGFHDAANNFYVITTLEGKVVTVVRGSPNVNKQ